MGIEVIVKPEDVDALVRDALVKSTIGKLINDTIASALKAGGYNNPVENAVREFVQRETRIVLEGQYKEKLAAAITAQLAEKLTDEWIGMQASQFADRLVRDIRDR